MLLIYILIISIQIPILVVVCVIRIEVWIIQEWFWCAKYSPKMSHVYEIHGEPFAWWSCKKLRQSSKNDIYSKRTKFVQKMSRKNFYSNMRQLFPPIVQPGTDQTTNIYFGYISYRLSVLKWRKNIYNYFISSPKMSKKHKRYGKLMTSTVITLDLERTTGLNFRIWHVTRKRSI